MGDRPEIGTALGWHGNQPTSTSTFMLTSDAEDQARGAQGSTLVTHMQDTSYSMFTDQAQARFNLTHDDGTDYSGAPMSDGDGHLFRGSFTSHCPVPMWGPTPQFLGKVGSKKLHPFTQVFQPADSSTGLYTDHKNLSFYQVYKIKASMWQNWKISSKRTFVTFF